MNTPPPIIVALLSVALATTSSLIRAADAPRENASDIAEASTIAAESVPQEIIVAFKPGSAGAQQEASRTAIGAKKIKAFAKINAEHWKLPPGLTVERALNILSANPHVRFAEPNYIVHTNQTGFPEPESTETGVTVPDDLLRGDLWGMHNVGQNAGPADKDIDAMEAWLDSDVQGSAPVVVGVIDSGIDYEHPDLSDKILRDANGKVVGWDFVNNDDDPMDDNRHGTHVAGTIAAQGRNGVGVIGVAGLSDNVKLVPIKFLSASGSGTTANAIAAVEYAASLNIRITNNSWGGGSKSQALEAAIKASGALFVAAAGNSGSSTLHYPAGYALPNVISVAATDAHDALASFSNHGSTWVHLGAPGANIISTTPGNSYSRFNGTSMATPHVAGAAALLLAQNPGLTIDQLKQQLLSTGDAASALAGKTVTGKRLNVYSALGGTKLLPEDIDPPASTALLAIDPATATHTSLLVSLTAASGDPEDGAFLYDVRYRANSPIVDDAGWNAATPVYGELSPPSTFTLPVQGLSPDVDYYFAVRVVDLAGNMSAISANAEATTVPLAWNSETVDALGNVGAFRSLAFTPAGSPIIAYSDETNNRVKLATRSGSNWNLETIGSGYGGISLALVPGSTGALGISWASSKLNFASKSASGAWSMVSIEKRDVNGQATSLAYAPDGSPAISYYLEASTGGLKFAWRSGSIWKTQLLDPKVNARYSALAFRTNGNAMIAYSHDANGDGSIDAVKFIEGTKTSTAYAWSAPIIIDGPLGSSGYFCSLAVDSAGNPVVVHRGSARMHLLRRGSDGVWGAAEKIEAAGLGTGCDIALTRDPATGRDRAYVSYIINSGGWKVNVATALLPQVNEEAFDWTCSLVNVQTAGPGKTSIKVAGGLPSLIYPISGDLRYSTEIPR